MTYRQSKTLINNLPFQVESSGVRLWSVLLWVITISMNGRGFQNLVKVDSEKQFRVNQFKKICGTSLDVVKIIKGVNQSLVQVEIR